jgi:D-galactose 1-dehydrogenase
VAFKSGEVHKPEMSAGFNWLEESGEIWTIAIETVKGDRLKLETGGTVLRVNDEVALSAPSQEYERIYERFAHLIDAGQSEVDDAPLRLTADIFLLGARVNGAPFEW